MENKVQTIHRTLDILEALSKAQDDITLSQLQEVVGLPVSTVHRLLNNLAERGYASQDRDTRRYGPGPKLVEIATNALRTRRFNLQLIVRPYLQELMSETGETSNLVVLHGHEIMYIDQVVSQRLVRLSTELGSRSPLYCTGEGKAILSGFPDHQIETYLRSTVLAFVTPNTITTSEQMWREIVSIRKRGFAIDDEEHEEGVRSIATPIFDHTGDCIAAIGISGPTTRISRERSYQLGPQVRHAAEACSTQLGYHVPTTTEVNTS